MLSIRRFLKKEDGVTAIEYGLIAVAVAVLIVAVFYNNDGFIGKLKAKFEGLATTVQAADTTKK